MFIIGRGRYARETYPLPARASIASSGCVVLISSLDDLPAPVAGVITLAPATNYLICGTNLNVYSAQITAVEA